MSGSAAGTDGAVEELVGIYHADGGVLGELRYVAARLLGRTHCALCDVTHSGVRRRPEWDAAVARLGVPVRLVHLNERSEEERLVSPRTPCLLVRVGGRLSVLLGPEALETTRGDVAAFEGAVRVATAMHGRLLP